MIELGSGHATSVAPPKDFFERWLDHDTWSSWSPDTEWVRIADPVEVGSRGVMKINGGPKVKFVVKTLSPGSEYTDTTMFLGARLDFQHTAQRTDGHTNLMVRVTMNGPLAFLWAKVVGGGFTHSAQEDLDRLVSIVEGA